MICRAHWMRGVATTALALTAMAAEAQTAPRQDAPAPAIDTPAAADAPATAAAPADVNDIIVTAQRRAERLENVPVSITAVTAATIQSSGVKRLDEIQQIAAGVQINKGGNFTQPSIRGISTLTLGYGFENNVAVYVDGFYQNDMVSINQDLGTVSSVQVLKGPQGTLYGRNATGGAIVIETLAPSDHFTASGTASYGNLDDKRAQGYVSAPIAKGVKFSVAGYIRDTDGYITDIGTDPNSKSDDRKIAPIRNISVRSKLEFDPTDNLKVTLAYNYGSVRDPRGLVYTVYQYYPAFGGISTLTCPNASPACANQPDYRAHDRDKSSINEVRSLSHSNEWTGKVQLKTAIGTLSSYTGYSERNTKAAFDFDASDAQISLARTPGNKNKTFQQTFDYAIDKIRNFDLIVGAFFYRDRFNVPFSGSYAGQPPVLQTAYTVGLKTDAMAYYIDGTLHIGDKLFLTAGGRYSAERRELDYNFTFPTITPGVERNADFDAFTPRAVIRYELAPRTNVYASYSKGFRSGVFNPVATTNPAFALPVKPEKIDAYEIGFKTASRRMRFDTAGWYYNFKDLQVGVSIPDPTDPAGLRLIQTIGNARKARSYGAEAQLQYTPIESLNLRAGAAWIHARYVDFANAVGTALVSATQTNRTGQVQDWSGQQMARAPNWSGNIGFDYGLDLARGRLNIAGNGYFTASYVVQNPSLYGATAGADLANKQRYRQSGYALFNSQVNWTDPSGHYTIGGYVDNLTDKRYTIINSGGAFGDYRQYNEPRTYGIRAGFKY